MFYFVRFSYSPSTAATNRAMAYVSALSEMGVPTQFVFFAPDKLHSKVENNYPNITFNYLWDRFYIDIPKLRVLSLRRYMRGFIRCLQPNDIVYVYGFPDLVVELSKRNDIKVYVERTESDEVSFVSLVKRITISDFHEACRKINGIFVISQALKDYYIAKGCQSSRINIINMIVDTTRFEGLKKQTTEKYIAYCGTASNNKDGVDLLIKSFAIVVNHYPNYKLYIIGSTPSKEQRFDNYELVKKLGIESSVVFTGFVSSESIPQILKDASILALERPNNLQAKYGFPTKLGEYLLTGNPVVITSVGDIPLFLKDGESAILVEPQNPQAFASRLCWAIENIDDARVIGQRGRSIAMTHFNYMTETKKIVDVVMNN